jgi:hypothetical protein
VEKIRSKPPMRVSKPIAFPKSEKILTYKAHEAVPEFVNSPVFAIATAPKESLEKKPGKKIAQKTNRIAEFRNKDAVRVELAKFFTT